MEASSSSSNVAPLVTPSKNEEFDLRATLQSLSKEELIQRIMGSSPHVDNGHNEEMVELREQLKVARRRENLAVLRLAIKEKQLREVMTETDWMRDKNGESNKVEDLMMDHAVGVVFAAMRSELRNARKEAKTAKMELRAIKGQAGNAESKKLAARCKSLEVQLAEAKAAIHRLARLETLLAYSQKTIDGLRRRQRDLDDVISEHDEEMSRIQTQLLLLQEDNARLREGGEHVATADSKASLSRPDSRVQPSSGTPDQHDHDGGDSDGPENKAAEEMVMVSSPEMDSEDNDGQRSAKRPKMELPSAGCSEEVIAVSSPEQDCEPDEVIVVSSPETSIQRAAISDESD